MRKFVIGDIHGQFSKLKEVLSLCSFDYDKDLLISLGDLVDRGPEPINCILELLKIKNLIPIRGNHDEIFMAYIVQGVDYFGGHHGVKETHEDWKKTDNETKRKVLNFLRNQVDFYVDEKNRLFVHGGYDRFEFLENQDSSLFYWDRTLVDSALSCSLGQTLNTVDGFEKIYVGHTPTLTFKYKGKGDINYPVFLGNKVWAMDTGAPFTNGKLSIMNIETEEYFQSK